MDEATAPDGAPDGGCAVPSSVLPGLEGERRVGAVLDALVRSGAAGWAAHDRLSRPGGTSTVDHVLVGTFGVVVVATRTWPGTAAVRGADLLHDGTEQPGVFVGLVEAVAAARRAVPPGVPVRGAVVLAGKARIGGAAQAGETVVADLAELAGWVGSLPRSAGPEAVVAARVTVERLFPPQDEKMLAARPQRRSSDRAGSAADRVPVGATEGAAAPAVAPARRRFGPVARVAVLALVLASGPVVISVLDRAGDQARDETLGRAVPAPEISGSGPSCAALSEQQVTAIVAAPVVAVASPNRSQCAWRVAGTGQGPDVVVAAGRAAAAVTAVAGQARTGCGWAVLVPAGAQPPGTDAAAEAALGVPVAACVSARVAPAGSGHAGQAVDALARGLRSWLADHPDRLR